MHEHVQLKEIALIIFSALLGGLGFARLRQPPILGYILTGVVLGPSAFALVHSRDQVTALAELGVLLLLFVIGIELNLKTFKRVWFVATFFSTLQILLSLGVTFLLAMIFNWSMGLSLLLGFVLALSSTAVVFKMLESLKETRTNSGQISVGILIAQDLAIIPMILIIKSFEVGNLHLDFFIKLFISIGLIILLIHYFSRTKRVRMPLKVAEQKDLVPLTVLAFCFGAAAISGVFGLSAPYGAFLAGIVIGNTYERASYIDSIKPIQSILMMLFFLSIGLLIDIRFVLNNLGTVFSLMLVVMLGKTALNVGILRLLKISWPQAFFIGTLISQLGEFSFLLSSIARKANIINVEGEKLIIALTVLSLGFSSVWLSLSKRLKRLAKLKTLSFYSIIRFIYSYEASVIKRFLMFFKVATKHEEKRNLLPKYEKKDDTTS